MEDSCVKIEIIDEIPFFGSGNSLENRLREVVLDGFTDVKIYGEAKFSLRRLTKDQIREEVSTPQPYVFSDCLDRQRQLKDLFAAKGIDISNLTAAYNYQALSTAGKESLWTLIPPILEEIVFDVNGGTFDYFPLLDSRVVDLMEKSNANLNQKINQVRHHDDSGRYLILMDGSHRVFSAEGDVTFLQIESVNQGFPYLALPQPYNNIEVVPGYDHKPATKLKVFDSNAVNYTLFRSYSRVGVFNGEARAYQTGAQK